MSPSPDVSGYTDLTLIDVTTQELVDAAVARLAITFPEWTPREAHTETVLLEAMAAMGESIIFRVNQLPAGVTEVLLRLFLLTRGLGTPATATATVEVLDDAGYTLPAGTLLRVDRGDDLAPVDFTLDLDLVIAPGDTSGTTPITSTSVGTDGNSIPAGTLLEVLDSVSYVDTVTLATTVGGGTEPETGDQFLTRGIPRLSRLTTTLVRPQDFEAYVTENAYAQRVKALDQYDPTSGHDVGADLGYVTVAVATTGGGALSAPDKATLEANLIAAAHAGLIITVVDADVTPVDVDVTVLRLPGYADADVEAAVTAILEDYLDADAWAWSRLVRVNELIAQADRAAGVDVVLAVTTPAGDLTLPGVAPLATAGTITVTVEAP